MLPRTPFLMLRSVSTKYWFHLAGDIIVVRYEAGANGYRVLPITEEEFAIMMHHNANMMKEDNAKTRESDILFSKHPQPQPIFQKQSNEENLFGSRTEENPSITTLATNLETETSKKYHKTAKNQKTAKNSGKKYQKTPKNSSPEEKSSPIIPAFLHPKVRKYQICLYSIIVIIWGRWHCFQDSFQKVIMYVLSQSSATTTKITQL